MAARFPTPADYFYKTSGVVPASGDYSCTFWLRPRTLPTLYLAPFSQMNGLGVYTEWVLIYGTTTSFLGAELNDGSSTIIASTLQELNNCIPVLFVREGTSNRFYTNGILRGTTVQDISAFALTEMIIGNDTFSDGICEISYFREWNKALTLAGGIIELNSPTVVDTVGLWSNTPLLTNGNDISGNARHWVAVGSPTFVDGPIPVPLSNLTSGTAYAIVGTLPQERVQIVSADGLAASIQDTWFKRTATIADGNQLGAFSWGGQPLIAGDYVPGLSIYEDGIFGSRYLSIPESFAHPSQFPITPGTDWYFEIEKSAFISGSVNVPAVLFVKLSAAPVTAPIAGDLYINDDTNGFPSIVLSSITDYLIKRFYPNIPAGEAGDIVSNGNFLLADINTGEYKLFDVNSNLLITFPSTTTFGYKIRVHKPTDTFYIAEARNAAITDVFLKNYSNVGVELSSITVTGSNRITGGLAVNDDQTILYHSRSPNGAVISRFNLNTLSAMSDLVGGVTNYQPQDMLFINGNLFVIYTKLSAPQSVLIKRYDEAGATLATYDLTAYINSSFTMSFPPRLAYANDNPTSFWVYIQRAVTGVGYVKFLNITIATGAIAINRNHLSFERGVNPDDGTLYDLNYPADFGPSESCPFFQLPEGATNSIEVVKVVVPSGSSQSFGFTTTGGLSPSTFNLEHGDNQVYSGLANGVYGITETPVDGWTTEYSVSNGDLPSAITLSGGTNVVVTVTNTQAPSVNSGIYKIVPDKRNDTLWETFDPNTTEDVKIPNPFSRTALIGE